MGTVAVVLIFAAVAIRAIFWYSRGPYLNLVIAILALFGCLLFSEPILERWLGKDEDRRKKWFQTTYLLLQMGLVMGLLSIPPFNDFPALLFVPLSLQAVLFFQQRRGFLWIACFTLAAMIILVIGSENVAQVVAMALLFGGCCFLAGSYSYLIRETETARQENLRTYGELQAAHRKLQGYALQRQELAAEKERARLARELHDSVTQTVFSMNLAVEAARFLWPQNPHRVNTQLERFLELADSAMHQIQSLVAHLGSEAVAGEGLMAAINQMVAERQTRDGLQVHLEVYGDKYLVEAVNARLYNIVQEALTNIVKHAGTRQATIRLNLDAAPMYMEIADNGIGFDIATTKSLPGHIGLMEMVEQASEIGWELSIDTQPGHGTRIRVEEKEDKDGAIE